MSEQVNTYLAETSEAFQIALQKAVLWEQAKGSLRAMVAAEGQCRSGGRGHELQRERWKKAQDAIEEFICTFEGDGLHE